MGCVVPRNRFRGSQLKVWTPISDKGGVLVALGFSWVVDEWIRARPKELSVPLGMNL